MGKSKAYQAALEGLTKQQNNISMFQSSSPKTSSTSSTTVSSKNQKCIPNNLNFENIYNPKYSVTELISTRQRPRKQSSPPRPPNSFFLFKNCYMLELRKLGYRYAMPDVCRQSRQLWLNIPAEVKDRYDILAIQAVILHQEMYPGYRFQPKKKQIFKPHVFPNDSVMVDSSMLNTFSVTNFLGDTNNTNDMDDSNYLIDINSSEFPQLASPISSSCSSLSSNSSPILSSTPILSSNSSPILSSTPILSSNSSPVLSSDTMSSPVESIIDLPAAYSITTPTMSSTDPIFDLEYYYIFNSTFPASSQIIDNSHSQFISYQEGDAIEFEQPPYY